nr:thiol reductant ABC exporter subunit CydD [Chromohalobacter nigrandesensis]
MAAQSREVRGYLSLAIAAGVVGGLATLAQLGLMAWLISAVVVHESALVTLWPYAAALAGAVIVRSLAQWLQETCGLEAGLRVKARVRAQVLDHLAALGPVSLAERHSAGSTAQLVDQVEALEGYIARYVPQATLAVVMPLIFLGVAFSLDWLAALFFLIAAPLIPLFMALIGMGAQRLNEQQFQAMTRLAGHFLDRVRGLTTLQLFGRTRQATEEVTAVADDYRRRNMKTLRVAFLSSAVLEFFASVSIAVIAIYIGFGLLGYIQFGPADQLTLFSGLFLLFMAPDFFQPLRLLAQHYHDRASALGAAEGLRALLAQTPPQGPRMAPLDSDDDTTPLRARLTEVSVTHTGRGRVLGPLDLDIADGEVVALVGPSGAGKSTLLQVLAGFVDAESGEVLLHAESRLAWLDQRPFLMQGTLAENLRLVAPEASDARLREALSAAQLGDLLAALPEGLDTFLGERGLGLSGGQASRLALARVFLSDAPLVLLDEPTASLDPDSERRVIEGLKQLAAQGRTLVIATHHPAVMAMADRVLRLEAGQLHSQDVPTSPEALS